MRRHAAQGTIAFGINHAMSDFKADREKDLDLVVCTPGSGAALSTTFRAMAKNYEVVLTAAERSRLESLPELRGAPVGVVHLALEAKATMTEHVKALPRLYDELTSSHVCIHGASNRVIAAGLSIINAGPEFISPKNNLLALRRRQPRVNIHKQPNVTSRTIDKLKQIARRSNVEERGFDAIAIILLNIRNDGTAVELIESDPAPQPGDNFHYETMIRRVAQLYEARFPHA
jgi:hypothetical protein